MSDRPLHIAALLLLLLYLVVGALFAWRTPAWQAPDEPAHYNYVAQVAAGTLLPVIEPGDWNNAYLEQLKADDFAPELLNDLQTVQYEDHQPPLYYWLLAPVFWLTNGSLLALRLVSVLIGAVTVGLSFAIAREMLPDRRYLSLAVMCLVAFIPQQVHILSSVNNDALAGAMIAATLLTTLRYLNGKLAHEWVFGMLLGVIVITKTTAYFMAGVVLLAVLLRYLLARPKPLWRMMAGVIVPAGVLAVLYWGRNLLVYGVPDFLGLRAHDAVVVGQLRTADYLADLGVQGYLERGLSTTFNSFWGQFGWMEAPMGDALPAVMSLITLLLLLSAGGWLLSMVRDDVPQPSQNPAQSRAMWALIGLVMTFALLQFAYYNSVFVQFQGRYIFAGLIPFALLVVVGLDAWRRLFVHDRAGWLSLLWVLWLIPLDVYLIWRVIPGAVSRL